MPGIRLLILVLINLAVSHAALAAEFVESFSSDPLQHGWKVIGDADLFQWDRTSQDLQVTWDSAQPNSYFYFPLGTVLTRYDDFGVVFDLRLNDIGPGADTNKATSFPIAVGFLNLDQATETNFIRGTGSSSPNLAEFSYFWDSGFGATTWPVLVDTNSTFNYNSASDYAVFALTPGDWYHVAMSYTSSNQTLVAVVTNAQNNSGVRITQPINSSFSDYRLGSFSFSSYSDAGQDPLYAGSVLAHGIIDNLVLTAPNALRLAAAGSVSNGIWQVQLPGETNWVYSLDKTLDFRSWAVIAKGSGSGTVTLSDTNTAAPAFYRVRATRP